MLFTKSIFDPKDSTDGLRVSVMSRHTKSDGKTPDERISPSSFDVHMPILAPSPKVVGAYYRAEIDFNTLASAYQGEMSGDKQKLLIKNLAQIAMEQPVTLLCVEKKDEPCHRVILAQLMVNCESGLRVTHL